jgi:hypothetical protein
MYSLLSHLPKRTTLIFLFVHKKIFPSPFPFGSRALTHTHRERERERERLHEVEWTGEESPEEGRRRVESDWESEQ